MRKPCLIVVVVVVAAATLRKKQRCIAMWRLLKCHLYA